MTVDFAIKGFNFPSWWNGNYGSAAAAQSLTSMAATGANATTINPTFYVNTATGSLVTASATKTESLINVGTEINTAHADGLSVMVKVAVAGLDGTASANLNPTNVAQFFASYKALVLQYATVAAADHAETLCIGTEMDQLTGTAYKAYWDDIISSVRQVYHGQVTYAANWNTAGNVSFWNEVDVIGVDGYVPLSTKANPTVDDLKAGWTTVPTDAYLKSVFHGMSPLDYYHSLSTTYSKPMMFTELGYTSTTQTASTPWGYTATAATSQDLQAKALEAYFETWGSQSSWFKGSYIWDWTTAADPTSTSNYATDFSVRGKEAQGVIASWYGTGVNPLTQSAATVAATYTPATTPQTLTGTAAAEALTGGTANDTITGGGGQDTLTGGAGNDHLIGGVGHALFYGGDGNDTIDLYDTPTMVDGGAGTDTVNVFGAVTFQPGALLNIEKLVVQNGGRADFSAFTNGVEVFSASTTGGVAAVIGGAGADTLHGGGGFDFLSGGAGNDSLIAGSGGGYLDGGAGNDRLQGGGAASLLTGGDGNDTIIGGAAGDTMLGGAGNDVFVVTNTPALIDGGDGSDQVQVMGKVIFTPSNLQNIELVLVGSGGSADLSAMTHAFNTASMSTAAAGGAAIIGTAYADTLVGGAGLDTLSGGGGADQITAGSGGSVINGGDGADFIRGGAGSDVINGGTGNDTMSGGASSDTFVFDAAFGKDTITDFTGGSGVGHDFLELHHLFASYADVMAHTTQVGTNVVITLDANDTITLQHMTKADLVAADFHFS